MFSLYHLTIVIVESLAYPLAHRAILFDDAREGFFLRDSSNNSQIHSKMTKSACAVLCAQTPECLSFNFCGFIHCQLNSVDAFSYRLEFETRKNCVYVGMKANFAPICKERETLRSVKDDSPPNRCETNQKRIDAKWTEWQDVISDTAEAWRRNQTRFCTMSFHGGIETCTGGTEEITMLDWIVWVRDPRNWGDSKTGCETLGGHLYDDLDGTAAQLEFFEQKLGCREHWTGVSRASQSSPWKYIDGRVFPTDRLLWGEGEPQNKVDDLAIVSQLSKLNDARKSYTMCSVCDMIQ